MSSQNGGLGYSAPPGESTAVGGSAQDSEILAIVDGCAAPDASRSTPEQRLSPGLDCKGRGMIPIWRHMAPIEVPTSAGAPPAFLARPPGEGPAPAVPVIMEAFRHNAHIKDVARRL